jgi:hypothetical protein
MVNPSSVPVMRTPASTGFDGGLVGKLRATQATASAKSSLTSRNLKSEPTVVVATSILSLHYNTNQRTAEHGRQMDQP